MAQGKKEPDQKYTADFNALDYRQVLEAIGNGFEIPMDDKTEQLTPIVFTRIARIAIEQNSKDIKHVGEMRSLATRLMENAVYSTAEYQGVRLVLEALSIDNVITDSNLDKAANIARVFQELYETQYRSTAALTAELVKDVELTLERKGKRGRPQYETDLIFMARKKDTEVLSKIAEKAKNEHGFRDTETTEFADLVESKIPGVVRLEVLNAQLPQGCLSVQDAVDKHSKRIRRLLITFREKSGL